MLTCVSGRGELETDEDCYGIAAGDVVLLPAELGACECLPAGEITLLECGTPA
jgi:quercetin dioxygenase-like cupin family protein